ncbi:DeoR/GlpR family DNA-binding transcription regulator [Massilia sp.]|uniref:DeoR/GlpR family DNA-binding transcription regulator n=1 Tax=Massilia sp. TaxID=1882437 RepID=UPI00352EE113
MNDLPLARRDVIAARLAAGQAANSTALALEFGVSEDAIRRDLRALAADGLCRRVYGGALPLSPASTPMATRIDEARERKEALARVGATLVEPGELVFLDNGSTNLALVRFLPGGYDLTVATNSIGIAAEVVKRKDLQLILLGGVVDPHVGGCVDANAVARLGEMNIDTCFVGACAVSVEAGVCAFNPADATFKRALRAAGRTTVVMATTEKLGTRAPYRIAAVKDVHRFILEGDAPDADVQALVQAGAPVLQAEPLS